MSMEETCKELNKLITYFQKLANNEESADSNSDPRLNLNTPRINSFSATTTPNIDLNLLHSLSTLSTSNSFEHLSQSCGPAFHSKHNQLSYNEAYVAKLKGSYKHPTSHEIFNLSLDANQNYQSIEEERLKSSLPILNVTEASTSEEQPPLPPGVFVMKKKIDDEISRNSSRKRSLKSQKKNKNVNILIFKIVEFP